MSNTRLTVVVRRDLQLSPGLLAAQVSHIADNWIRSKVGLTPVKILSENGVVFTPTELEWMKEPYISVLAVNTKEELEKISIDATNACLKVYAWKDVIFSEVLKLPMSVLVGVSIGPDDFDKIKLVTGNLPLY